MPISISDQFEADAPPDEIWALFCDPQRVASCIPGAMLTGSDGGDTWEGSMTVKFGPTTVSFRGQAALKYDHDKKVCAIEGRGIDQRGASRALASGTVAVRGDTATTVLVDGSYDIAGPIEVFAKTGGTYVAKALIAEFARNLQKLVEADRRSMSSPQSGAPPAAETDDSHAQPQPRTVPPPLTQLSAFRILWQALLAWFHRA